MCRIISFIVVIIFAVLYESNGNGNGCEWSGCREFATTPCKTGVTGGSGRHNLYRTKSCGFFGRKDFCCDDDCGYVECGTVTSGTKYTDKVAPMQCGVGSQQMFKEFVCGTTGVVPLGISALSGRRENGFRESGGGSSFRSSEPNSEISGEGDISAASGRRENGFRENGGETSFRSSQTNSEIGKEEGFRSSNRGGFRAGSETLNDTNVGISDGGRFRSSDNGFRT